jgi:H+-transporting ATPase
MRRGEIEAMVCATGTNTCFGKTSTTCGRAHPVNHFEKAVLKIGDYFIVLAVVLV